MQWNLCRLQGQLSPGPVHRGTHSHVHRAKRAVRLQGQKYVGPGDSCPCSHTTLPAPCTLGLAYVPHASHWLCTWGNLELPLAGTVGQRRPEAVLDRWLFLLGANLCLSGSMCRHVLRCSLLCLFYCTVTLLHIN